MTYEDFSGGSTARETPSPICAQQDWNPRRLYRFRDSSPHHRDVTHRALNWTRRFRGGCPQFNQEQIDDYWAAQDQGSFQLDEFLQLSELQPKPPVDPQIEAYLEGRLLEQELAQCIAEQTAAGEAETPLIFLQQALQNSLAGQHIGQRHQVLRVWCKAEASGPPKFSDLIEELYDAIYFKDVDLEMSLRAQLRREFLINEDQINDRVFRLLQAAANCVPAQKPKSQRRRSINLRAVAPLEWLVPGFLVQNDITLLWGEKGAGKTTLGIELALAVQKGTGLLDRLYEGVPRKALFVATDSGAGPLLGGLTAMGVSDKEIDSLEVWAHEPEQESEAWGVDLRGRIDLFEWARGNRGGLVVLDSVKSITSRAGVDYCNNTSVTELLGFLKECVCPYVSVLVLAHGGTRANSAGGAASWEEIPSMVISVRKPTTADGGEETHRRQFTVRKSRLQDDRSFFYAVTEDGRLKCSHETLVVSDVRSLVESYFLERHRRGDTSPVDVDQVLSAVQQRNPKVCRATVLNNLSNLCKGKSPMLERPRGRRGQYRIRGHWLRGQPGHDGK